MLNVKNINKHFKTKAHGLLFSFYFNICGVATVLNPVWSVLDFRPEPIRAEILKLAQ